VQSANNNLVRGNLGDADLRLIDLVRKIVFIKSGSLMISDVSWTRDELDAMLFSIGS
jgi:hypothetical protein